MAGAIQILEKGVRIRLKILVFPGIRTIRRSPFAVEFTPFQKEFFRVAVSDAFDNREARSKVLEKIAEACNVKPHNVTFEAKRYERVPAFLPKHFPSAKPDIDTDTVFSAPTAPTTSSLRPDESEEKGSTHNAHFLTLSIRNFEYPDTLDPDESTRRSAEDAGEYWKSQALEQWKELTEQEIETRMVKSVEMALNEAVKEDGEAEDEANDKGTEDIGGPELVFLSCILLLLLLIPIAAIYAAFALRSNREIHDHDEIKMALIKTKKYPWGMPLELQKFHDKRMELLNMDPKIPNLVEFRKMGPLAQTLYLWHLDELAKAEEQKKKEEKERMVKAEWKRDTRHTTPPHPSTNNSGTWLPQVSAMELPREMQNTTNNPCAGLVEAKRENDKGENGGMGDEKDDG